eukprot:CAMPEP_0172156996 /NCGR_PEP_ID=MMETSP1050-20130122/3539_1 /TAXON_ID=233186 /ORGANISM="Cryptomonas curvata, Strain CCAP979/52" /LENGTH=628 /DNA_ID=CAMNT_0012826163 /DNA_START=69 /DNA_END=1954 /DNA_ORIENTATION=-
MAGGLMKAQFGKHSPFIEFFEHGPWLLEHYFAACANTDFFECVRNNFDPFDDDVIDDPSSQEVKISMCKAQVEEKFYFAGASARWMFANTVHSVQDEIARYVDQVKNFEQLLNEGHGIQSSESSSHLLMRYQGTNGPESFFVSRYALKMLLYASKDKSDIQRAFALAKQHNNPAFLGWVVEFDFLKQLSDSCANSAKVINLYSNVDGNIFWKISSVTSFDPHSPFEEPWLLNQFRTPIKWNQGGYDAVGLFKVAGKLVLRFLQVTQGRTHKMKMKFFASLAAKFSAEYPSKDIGVEIFLILPRFQGSKFMLQSTPKIVKSGLLTRYLVGINGRHWPEQNEELEISTLYFDADFADRRGRGFMDGWQESCLGVTAARAQGAATQIQFAYKAAARMKSAYGKRGADGAGAARGVERSVVTCGVATTSAGGDRATAESNNSVRSVPCKRRRQLQSRRGDNWASSSTILAEDLASEAAREDYASDRKSSDCLGRELEGWGPWTTGSAAEASQEWRARAAGCCSGRSNQPSDDRKLSPSALLATLLGGPQRWTRSRAVTSNVEGQGLTGFQNKDRACKPRAGLGRLATARRPGLYPHLVPGRPSRCGGRPGPPPGEGAGGTSQRTSATLHVRP